MTTRGDLLGGACAVSAATDLLGVLRRSHAWKGDRPTALDGWTRAVVTADERGSRGELDVFGGSRR